MRVSFITSFYTHTELPGLAIGGSNFLLLEDIAGKGMSLSEK